jgi:Family of unknown function (DUF6600)
VNAEFRLAAEVMKRMRRRALFVLSAGAGRLFTLVCVSLAMLGVALADEPDPPGRVARVSYLQGSVSLQPAGVQDWVGAEINRPLTTDDKVWADAPGSRAELDMGGAVVRLNSGTGFSFLNLNDNIAQMQVTTGTVVVHVRELSENQTYEIDTPNLAVLLDEPGQYRIDVNESGDSTVVRVSDGHAEASNGGESMPIANQQMVTYTGTEDQVSATASTLGAPDGFDDWSFERDREYDQAASRQYVADDLVGTEDLDDNGDWQNTPDYGYVWVPTAVATGWAPYSFGHWAWVSPWGWTWIDAAPWGFAPFHYGRWARWHNSWCWIPGPRQVRPIYSPAMVAWVGGGAGGVAVSWFPLGPREVFVPGYRVSDRYVRTINVTNTTIVNQTYITNVYQSRGANVHYVNSSVAGAVTTVPRNVFTAAQPVSGHRMSAPEGGSGSFATTGAPPAIAPGRQSVLGGPRVAALRPPQVFMNRTVVARTPLPAESSARVRLVAPSQRSTGRGPGFNGASGFNRPGPGGQQASQAGAGFNRPAASGQQPGQVGAGFNRPQAGAQQAGQAGSGQPRQPAPAAPSMQRRPEVPQQPAAETDTRSWAERAHALEQHALPPTQGPRNDRPYEPREFSDGTSDPARYQPTGQPNTITRESDGQTFRPAQQPRVDESERASFGGQSGRAEQERAPVNNYNRPGDDRRSTSVPEQRFNVPGPPPAPVPHFNTPAPPPAPVPHINVPGPPPAPVPQAAPRTAPAPQQPAQPSNRGGERPPRMIGRPDSPH